MNSNPLVPTPIVDKNGRQTTVHRRLVAVSATSSVIPAPAVSPSSARELTPYERRTLVDRIDHAARSYSRAGRSEEFTKPAMLEYPDELLLRIEDVQRQETESMKFVNYLVMEGTDANEVSEMIHFAPLMHSPQKLFVARNILRALHNYSQLPPSDDYGKEVPEVRKKAEAVVRVSDAVFSFIGIRMFHGLGSTMDNDPLIDLAVENPDKADLIAGVIKQRKTTDAGILRAVMEADSLPLSDGVL